MEFLSCDVLVVGGGGAGLRAAIAVAETHPVLRVAVISKVYPMRSHTVSAEGGAAAVIKAVDTWQGLLRGSIASAGNDHRLDGYVIKPRFTQAAEDERDGQFRHPRISSRGAKQRELLPAGRGIQPVALGGVDRRGPSGVHSFPHAGAGE